ncbi:Na(+)-translocating NADH-quinone reductase subunit C [Rasiella sp. SM2506]|uniref:Na(+)-translocating NADH-quinone reductase subunit C n=1 Tax=Rasiella sp. SM2506 TaxID=3423914 RepID=UPI003D7A021D
MAVNKDSNVYTIIFAVIMVLVVGSLLAGFASGLKPMVKANEKNEKQQNILYAIGINDNEESGAATFITENVQAEFDKYIKKQYVIEGDKVTENPEAYLIDIKKEGTKAKKEGYVRRLPLFVGEKDGKEVYVVPVRGKGLWDAIWGFIAMDKSMTIQGVYFDHKGETPGLGAEIKQRYFMDDFTGEKFLDGDVFKGISVAKGNNDPKNIDKTDFEVDALAGATITGDGVAAMLKKDMKMYVPYFKSLNK